MKPMLYLALACAGFAGCDPAVSKSPSEPGVRVTTAQFYPVVAPKAELSEFENRLACITNGHVRAFWNLVEPETLARLTPEQRREGLRMLENITAYTLSVYHCDDENEFECAYLARLDCTRLETGIGSPTLRFYLREKDGTFSIAGDKWLTDEAK